MIPITIRECEHIVRFLWVHREAFKAAATALNALASFANMLLMSMS